MRVGVLFSVRDGVARCLESKGLISDCTNFIPDSLRNGACKVATELCCCSVQSPEWTQVTLLLHDCVHEYIRLKVINTNIIYIDYMHLNNFLHSKVQTQRKEGKIKDIQPSVN